MDLLFHLIFALFFYNSFRFTLTLSITIMYLKSIILQLWYARLNKGETLV